MTSYDFAISGQHYLFNVQTFAHTVLALGGDAYAYALRDRTTQGVIDDVAGNTLVAASSLDKEIEGNGGNKTAARAVGKLVAERCKAKGIDTVVFDRGGYLYHGRVAELAEGAREGGLEF